MTVGCMPSSDGSPGSRTGVSARALNIVSTPMVSTSARARASVMVVGFLNVCMRFSYTSYRSYVRLDLPGSAPSGGGQESVVIVWLLLRWSPYPHALPRKATEYRLLC